MFQSSKQCLLGVNINDMAVLTFDAFRVENSYGLNIDPYSYNLLQKVIELWKPAMQFICAWPDAVVYNHIYMCECYNYQKQICAVFPKNV